MGSDEQIFGRGGAKYEAANLQALMRSGGLDGVRLWLGAPDPAAVSDAARAEDWATRELPGEGVHTKRAYLALCATTFEFPEYFGGNWDALEECLGDIGDTDAEGLLVIWHGWEELATAQPTAFATALEIWQATADSWEAQGDRAGVVLLTASPRVPQGLKAALSTLPRVPC